MSRLVERITSKDDATRDHALVDVCADLSFEELRDECVALDRFRRTSDNLYERVRALAFLSALHRDHLPKHDALPRAGLVPYDGHQRLLERRFEEAVDRFLAAEATDGPSETLSSALAAAYHQLGFQTLADQVRRSVRSAPGNRWMFRVGHPDDHPLRLRHELTTRSERGFFPVLHEQTPVRMDLSHSGWSDIFFLGMDCPERARVLNVSVDLGVVGRDDTTRPPISTFLRVLDEPVLRLTSVDLDATADLDALADVFDFAKDHLGLLKAGLIAAGIVPPGVEGSGQSLRALLARLAGPGHGLELVTQVHGIPKGSRLAVSTNLLGSIISACMRATGQAQSLEGTLDEDERRVVAARAILGEWLGGSGGGWQDSGGVWPGIKRIEGVVAQEGDTEWGVSRGCLLPRHHLLGEDEAPERLKEDLQKSLVLVHGGMAQNVGPILEMVTERYLLRSPAEWAARDEAKTLFDELAIAMKHSDLKALGDVTTRNFFGPLRTIIPWASNAFTEAVIERTRAQFGDAFWGFWMLGGMSGGGMGFIFDPRSRADGVQFLAREMVTIKRSFERGLPFAMDPVVYDFAVNERGTRATLGHDQPLPMPDGYDRLHAPLRLRRPAESWSASTRLELEALGIACQNDPAYGDTARALLGGLFPLPTTPSSSSDGLRAQLDALGFDAEQHERIRGDVRAGRIGLAQNRLPASTTIEDVHDGDVVHARQLRPEDAERGRALMARGGVAVVTLAGGAASRWTQGAGVVKALHPFCRLAGRYRTFLDVHVAKSRHASDRSGSDVPHIFTTSHFTHDALRDALAHAPPSHPVTLSPGRAIGLRLVPTERDLRFLWEETAQQRLDEQAQKVRESAQAAWIAWARAAGEASDYTDNRPAQCLHPIGHWFEVPNLLRNGTLRRLLAESPSLEVLFLHNIDTLGADIHEAWLGRFLAGQRDLAFEVIPRRLEDQGGGLARVDGRVRLVEGLAMPREEDEFRLTYYNSMTTWIHIDRLLQRFGLTRASLANERTVDDAVRRMAQRMPTYLTHKEVKKRWGHGQEDLFPVAQWEKLWSDMTALPDVSCEFFVVPRVRGQQLKDPAQLDGWVRDGSADAVSARCLFEDGPAS